MHQTKRKLPATKGEALDKYFTKPAVVRRCLQQLEEMPYEYDCIIEPSAGSGAFYDAIEHPCKIGIDLEPEHDDVIQGNWLQYIVPVCYDKVLILGNPPYGQYHKLSSAFIKRAMFFTNVQTVAFILPNVYRKHTRQRIIPHQWRIASITDLGRDAFMLDGKNHHVPTSFFVFDKSRGKDLRVDTRKPLQSNDFYFSTKEDFDVFVFGASPRKITERPTANNRGHYLKAKIAVPTLIERIQKIDWKGNSCANGGVYWLTKHEFMDQYVSRYESR